MQVPFSPSTQRVPRMFTWWCLLGFLVSLLLFSSSACRDVPGALPDLSTCLSSADCLAGTICASGTCVKQVGAATGDGGGTKDVSGECKDGETQTCAVVANEAQRQKGICRDGTKTCTGGKWGECLGEIPPKEKEECNNADDNCDGAVDEGCDCEKGKTRPCGSGEGECKTGTQTCLGKGVWSDSCVGSTEPTKEVCDGKDNDCNGSIDETFPSKGDTCIEGVGECAVTGELVCSKDKQSLKCTATAAKPGVETCNDKDDDCNGVIDDNVDGLGDKKPCQLSEQKGICASGHTKCLGGKEVCTQVNFPQKEKCNGKDDDCDGNIDEQLDNLSPLSKPCYTGESGTEGIGTCRKGTQICQNGSFGKCENEIVPKATETCDGKDEDCDGQIDNNTENQCNCIDGRTRFCGSNTGECQQGEQLCEKGSWGKCNKEVKPVTEVCNNKDDDCNGKIDDGIPSQSCQVGSAKGPCKNGVTTCEKGQEKCVQTVQPQAEVCDGKDTNCDGKSDACQSGQEKCSGKDILRCKNDCEGWEKKSTCRSNQRCDKARCLNCSCTAGQTRCSGTSYLLTCRSDCSGENYVRCPSGRYCSNGACVPCVCQQGRQRCNPNNDRYIQSCYCSRWSNVSDCGRYRECYYSSFLRRYSCRWD